MADEQIKDNSGNEEKLPDTAHHLFEDSAPQSAPAVPPAGAVPSSAYSPMAGVNQPGADASKKGGETMENKKSKFSVRDALIGGVAALALGYGALRATGYVHSNLPVNRLVEKGDSLYFEDSGKRIKGMNKIPEGMNIVVIEAGTGKKIADNLAALTELYYAPTIDRQTAFVRSFNGANWVVENSEAAKIKPADLDSAADLMFRTLYSRKGYGFSAEKDMQGGITYRMEKVVDPVNDRVSDVQFKNVVIGSEPYILHYASPGFKVAKSDVERFLSSAENGESLYCTEKGMCTKKPADAGSKK